VDRVLVAGISGAGKTTLAQTLSDRLGLQHYELDALCHGSGWTKRLTFESDVYSFSGQRRWVTEDSYHSFLGELLWQRADTLIWLDLPRYTVMRRVLHRSIIRAAMQQELWNGNYETWRGWIKPDHPIRWAWSQFDLHRKQTADRLTRHPHLMAIHLRSIREANRWLATIVDDRK